jgi:crotonobetainyl-CoA:carnitine CoA-transferase CaiB-like acyl-CoA transferase
MSFTGEPEGGPMRYPIAIADMTCGMYAAMGILGALFAREKTGQGQFLDMALFDSQLTWLANAGSSYLNANSEPRRWGNAHPNIVPYEVFRADDGKYFVVAVGTERLWKKFVEVLQARATLGADERFASNSLRIEHRAELVAMLQEHFDAEPRDTWLERFTKAGIPAAPINTTAEALRDPQAFARGLIVEIEHPALREVRSIANPVRFSEMPVSYRLPPPRLSEHTDEILRGLGIGS